TIVVMYAGQQVEVAPTVRLTDHPAHPYTQLLLSAAPDPDRGALPPSHPTRSTDLAGTPGSRGEVPQRGGGGPNRKPEPPSLAPPSGCRFHPRCPHAMEICRRQAPPSVAVSASRAACWLHVEPAERRENRAPDQRSEER